VHSLHNVIIFNAMQYTNTEKVALARKASLPGCSIASGQDSYNNESSNNLLFQLQ